MKISYKLIVGFLSVAILASVPFYFTMKAYQEIDNAFGRLMSDPVEMIKALESLKFAGVRIVSSTSEYGFIHNESEASEEVESTPEEEADLIASGREQFEDSVKRYEELLHKDEPEEVEALRFINHAGLHLIETSGEIIRMKQAGVSGERILEKKEEFEKQEQIYLDVVNKALRHEYDELTNEQINVQDTIASATQKTLILRILSFVLAIGLGLYVSRQISRRIDRLREAFAKIGQGELDVTIEVQGSDEIGELAASFNQMAVDLNQSREELQHSNSKLQQSNRELQDFAFVASHDLQEPLRKIRAFASRLEKVCAEDLPESGLDYIARMQSAAERMQTLIQDLLTFSRVTTKAQPFVSVDLTETVKGVLSDLEIQIEESGAQVVVDALPVVEADATQMRQLIQNLVGNALKFRTEGVAPVITINAAPAGPDRESTKHYSIQVKDNGIGFDEKYREKIFTVFQRLHGRSEYEGSGVGLAVCRRIVERHNGKITANSRPGEGATFTVTLPRKQDEQNIHGSFRPVS